MTFFADANAAVVCRAPPLNVRLPVPSCVSLATATVPAFMVVPPLYVLTPVKVRVPTLFFVNEPVPDSTPAYVPPLLDRRPRLRC